MSRIARIGSRFRQLLSPKSALTPTSTQQPTTQLSTLPAAKPKIQTHNLNKQLTEKDKLRGLQRPDLYIVRLLLKNGAMTSDQIWSTYERELKAAKKKNLEFQELFDSKNHLKQKTLALMREHERIKSKGFDRASREHLGWELTNKSMRNIRAPMKNFLKEQAKKERAEGVISL